MKTQDFHFPIRWDEQTEDWYRLTARTKLFVGDHLRVLPAYRPEIVLSPGIQVLFAEPSVVHLTPPSPEGEATLRIDYGQAYIGTAGIPGNRVHLQLGDRTSTITFLEAASEVAIEVRRWLSPGNHPERGEAVDVVRVFTRDGGIAWQDEESAPAVEVQQGEMRIITNGRGETMTAMEVPNWVYGEDLRDIDRAASITLNSLLVPERSIKLSLKEQLTDRRTEIRSLAASSLAYLGDFSAIVAELRDSRQRAHWSTHFDVLRQLMASSPETAVVIRETWEMLDPQIADQAYRLLYGYRDQDLSDGADQTLVDLLDHESLTLRVLAFENLRRITGKSLFYMPHITEEQRRGSVRNWRERLAAGAIRYDSPPQPHSTEW